MAEQRLHLDIHGIVQGVGFRPFLHRLTDRYSLSGWVRNTAFGVELELEGEFGALDAFVMALKQEHPSLAMIRQLLISDPLPLTGEQGFRILPSTHHTGRTALVSPDVGICPDCLRELRDPNDRRHRYPFLNCTNCGPRFTIVRNIPYDRERTSMSEFPMCPTCQREYDDIIDRRYHAQPTCCPDCGPTLSWLDANGEKADGNALGFAKAALRRGEIIAVKGLGAFHLACLPREDCIQRLRQRKHRDEKPFALMCADLESAQAICTLSPEEEDLLTSWRRPIVLLKKRPTAPEGLSDNGDLGLMLPYTPLHYLLMEEFPLLVMTSANLSDFPAIIHNSEAVSALAGVSDGFLLHDREIVTRCDDSVMRLFRKKEYPLRRSRGYAPQPLTLNGDLSPILACGGEQKASFCLSRGSEVFLSQHMGDLKNAETLAHYEGQIGHFQRLFDITPTALVCDAHPDYLSTKYAEDRAKTDGLPLIRVQHHHAHMVSCMADNNLTGSCIGLVWDGTGYGSDGTIWGGECLVGNAKQFDRFGSLRPIPLPGGDLCTKEIGRIAHALLRDCGLSDHSPLSAERAETVTRQLEADFNCPRSSGMGRLFDGIYSLLTGRTQVAYEGQGAILLEAMAVENQYIFPLSFTEENDILWLDHRPIVRALAEQLARGSAPKELAGSFMNTLVLAALALCERARSRTGLDRVVLSGGVFQNMYLLPRVLDALTKADFKGYHHSRVSTNDEGIALGQLLIADAIGKDH